MKFSSNMRMSNRVADKARQANQWARVGGELVAKAGSTMQGVVASVQRMTDIMGEITHDGAEQGTGIGHVTHTIHDMDRSTQQNAALVEQAAADSLRSQAQSLKAVVSLFKLEAAR